MNHMKRKIERFIVLSFGSDAQDDNDADAIDCDNLDDEDTPETSSEYQELNEFEQLITNETAK